MTEILENRNGKIIIEVIEATVLDNDGNASDAFGFYVKYENGKYRKGDKVQSVAVCALWRSQMRFSTAAMRSRTAARI